MSIEDWQIFISFKNLDAAGNPTRDSVLARELYQAASVAGWRVFFSNVTLEALGVSAYKRAIEDALDKATVLILVGTKRDHVESDWVRYEWDSFHNEIISGTKRNARIFCLVEGMQPATLPRALRQTQIFEAGDDGLQKLLSFITNGVKLRRSPRSYGYPWYEVLTAYGLGAPEIDIECKQCCYRMDFTPSARESPPDACPQCGLK